VFDGCPGAPTFWGEVPRHVAEAIAFTQPLVAKFRQGKNPIFTTERAALLCQAIVDVHRRCGMLTDQVKQNLSLLIQNFAVVEAGHQPAVLGGPGFVVNKLAAISAIARLRNMTPLMFVGDHDHEQSELTVVHLPSPGPSGITFSLPVPDSFRLSPLHTLPLPPKTWLIETMGKIEATYHELTAHQPRERRQLHAQRTKTVLRLLQHTYEEATGLADWTMRLWMELANMNEDAGILFQPFSHPVIRRLALPAFEYLLNPKIRRRFVAMLNHTAEQLQKAGYLPGIGLRSESYVPFYLECPTAGCNRTRLEPSLEEHPASCTFTIEATCPKCKSTHALEVAGAHPDLSPWAEFLSPRVDTRSLLVQTYTPVVLHVGGDGETSYYAQVSPALRAVDAVPPVFFKYTRLFYGNPWTEILAAKLRQEKYPTLDPATLWTFRAAVATSYREDNAGVARALFAACGEHIEGTAQQLVKKEAQLERRRTKKIVAQRQAPNLTKSRELRAEIRRLTDHRQALQTYQSQMFGRYALERFGQEVSFSWIDAAQSLGPAEFFARLKSHYHPLTPSAATFYLPDQV
jgi:uncharacterized protein YllA (UPF0747 family)